jgi:ribosomal protein L11 methyltransferase
MLDVQDRDLLDIGCGSGVLAIAGALLGARSAVGLDVDPDALQSAAENTALNGVAGRVRLQEGDFRELATPYAVVLANLTGALLERHASTLAALVEPDGYLVVSGFLDGETSVVSALENFLALQSVSREDEWRCAIFQRLA